MDNYYQLAGEHKVQQLFGGGDHPISENSTIYLLAFKTSLRRSQLGINNKQKFTQPTL